MEFRAALPDGFREEEVRIKDSVAGSQLNGFLNTDLR
jgi:hypothetical protein